MIPRHLHRIVLPPLRPTGKIERYWQSLGRMHPAWTLTTWDRVPAGWEIEPLVKHAAGPAQVADMLRLEILWREGGIYLDTDCQPVRPLDPLLTQTCFLGSENNQHYSIGVIGCEPGHPAIRAYLDAILAGDWINGGQRVNDATGPGLATKILGPREDVTLLPAEAFYAEPMEYADALVRLPARMLATPASYVIHRWAFSWRDETTPLKRRLRVTAHVVRRAARQALHR